MADNFQSAEIVHNLRAATETVGLPRCCWEMVDSNAESTNVHTLGGLSGTPLLRLTPFVANSRFKTKDPLSFLIHGKLWISTKEALNVAVHIDKIQRGVKCNYRVETEPGGSSLPASI